MMNTKVETVGKEKKQPGILFLIGGAEDKDQEKAILKRFFLYCGGKDQARISILPTGSQNNGFLEIYREIFTELGAQAVSVARIYNREDANSNHAVEVIRHATGIFITGGNQNLILSALQPSKALDAIKEAFADGITVGGTSAGASALSHPMIAGGRRGSLPRAGMVKVATGLGLTRKLIIDQHFQQRERLGRLLCAVSLHPGLIGIGIDEDTAAIISPDGLLEVIGRGTVTIVDSSRLQTLGATEIPRRPLTFTNVVIHTLAEGWRFDLNKKIVIPNP